MLSTSMWNGKLPQKMKEKASTTTTRLEVWKFATRRRFYIQPDVGTFSPPQERKDAQKVNLKRDYANKGLQIIIKLANIHLTPEKPEYPGGTWHKEGQLVGTLYLLLFLGYLSATLQNEHICASAIYYYDCDNISPYFLAFRQAVNPDHIQYDVYYNKDDIDWLGTIYGMDNWRPGIQNIGVVETCEGRLITFPNVLQH